MQKYILIVAQVAAASEAYIDARISGNDIRLPVSDILQSIAFDAFDN